MVGLAPAQYRMAQQDIRSVLDAAIPMFGSPESGVKGLDEFAAIAESKPARARLASAFQIANMLGDAIGTAKIGGEGGGVSVSLGSIGELLEQKLGIPASLAASRAKTLQDTIGAMTPEERDYYNAVIAARESIVGLRKATSGSSAKFAVDAMQHALPEIGVNVFDVAGYRNMMDRQAEIFNGAIGGQVTGAMSSAQKERLKRIVDRQKKGSTPATPAGGPVKAPDVSLKPKAAGAKLDKPTAQKYLDRAGGDATKARALAKADGWEL